MGIAAAFRRRGKLGDHAPALKDSAGRSREIAADLLEDATPPFVPVCTENLIRVDDVMESLKLAE